VNKIVLDASAILAVLGREPGAEQVLQQVMNTAAGTVNLAEVHGKLVGRGVPKESAWDAAVSLVHEVVSFDSHQAALAGALVAETKSLGLSLGDRACLALGVVLDAPVFTTDKSWRNLKLGIKIHVIR
jgi:PIN domain nuclease of toxin-antitoxin system